MNFNPILLADFYKLSHRNMYPEGTQYVYSTWTPRASRMEGVEKVVFFGLQAFIKTYLIDYFNDNFFNRSIVDICIEYKRFIKYTLGEDNTETKHLEELHKLQYLPLLISAVPEGSLIPLRMPMITIINTDERFFWLTNYIETLMSCQLWLPCTSATIAYEYKKLLNAAALETVGNIDFVKFQGHDFSMRGMSSLESAVLSGMGHLLSFSGTDTIPAILAAEGLYGANIENELIGTSIPASEHSVQCAYEDDWRYILDLITRIYPSGMVSIVCDGYDFWKVIGSTLPSLKQTILQRQGKVVIRPDSGDPVLILCGDESAEEDSLQRKGTVEALWDIFGGITNEKGYKVLHPNIGLIYGDSITLARAKEIINRLKEKGFASTNVVFGIGSYTYQYNTRDTFGFALKSTWCKINGQEKQIFKDPKTDDGIKKSQKGMVFFEKKEGIYHWRDGLSSEEMVNKSAGDWRNYFENGKFIRKTTFNEIREILSREIP